MRAPSQSRATIAFDQQAKINAINPGKDRRGHLKQFYIEYSLKKPASFPKVWKMQSGVTKFRVSYQSKKSMGFRGFLYVTLISHSGKMIRCPLNNLVRKLKVKRPTTGQNRKRSIVVIFWKLAPRAHQNDIRETLGSIFGITETWETSNHGSGLLWRVYKPGKINLKNCGGA